MKRTKIFQTEHEDKEGFNDLTEYLPESHEAPGLQTARLQMKELRERNGNPMNHGQDNIRVQSTMDGLFHPGAGLIHIQKNKNKPGSVSLTRKKK